MVALCTVLTVVVEAVNPALLAFAAIVTLAGTVSAESLLARFTVTPPLPAGVLSVTAQLSLPVPTTVGLLQDTELSVASIGVDAPAPLSAIVGLPEAESLVMVRLPATAPAAWGRNSTLTL
jgi:hypothetical protein